MKMLSHLNRMSSRISTRGASTQSTDSQTSQQWVVRIQLYFTMAAIGYITGEFTWSIVELAHVTRSSLGLASIGVLCGMFLPGKPAIIAMYVVPAFWIGELMAIEQIPKLGDSRQVFLFSLVVVNLAPIVVSAGICAGYQIRKLALIPLTSAD